MALPTFVAAGAKAAGAAAVTPALPAGIATDDILLLFAESISGQAVTIPTPNGGTWTQVLDSPQDSTGTRLTAFWSRYNGTQGAPTTNDPGDHICCFIAAFRGCITSGDPWNVTSGGIENTSDTSLSATGDTTTVADCLVVIACCTGADSNAAQFSSWANADLASVTEPAGCDVCTNSAGGGGVACATGQKASAGAYGATTATLATASTKGFMTIALRPPAVTTVDKTHTTDSLLKAAVDKTHTTDSLLKAATDRTHQTDGLLKATADRTHTTDSILKATGDKVHTTDSFLKATVDKTHTTDGLLKGTLDRVHSTDALLKTVSEKSHTTDSFLKFVFDKTHTVDSLLKGTSDRSHTSDSLLKATFLRSHSSDALLRRTVDRTHASDSLLQASVDKAHQSDSLLRAMFERDHTTDSLLSSGGTTSERTHSTDTWLAAQNPAPHSCPRGPGSGGGSPGWPVVSLSGSAGAFGLEGFVPDERGIPRRTAMNSIGGTPIAGTVRLSGAELSALQATVRELVLAGRSFEEALRIVAKAAVRVKSRGHKTD